MSYIPLAARIRPNAITDIVGQEHLLDPQSVFRKMIDADHLISSLYYGPAGTGKTTIASVIANKTKSKFVKLNATTATIKDIKTAGDAAKKSNTNTILFVDEISRFSKTQQEALLSYVEDGHLILIGALISNPYHCLSSSLLSRCHIFQFKPLSNLNIGQLIVKAIKHLKDETPQLSIDNEAIKHVINISNGDGRKAIALIEAAYSVIDENNIITKEIVQELSPTKYVVFNDDMHFDWASALQGSIQASDVDAAVYWLAVALESGEDPRYIARRIMVSASEDAADNPHAATIAHSAYVSACEIGRPECDIILSHAVIAIATSKRDKSAAKAIWAAVGDVKSKRILAVPPTMKDCHYPGAKELGHGSYKDGRNQEAYVGIGKKYYHKPAE